jgi:hypothetical protein
LQELTYVGERTGLGARSREAHEQRHDSQRLHLAAHRNRVHGAVRIDAEDPRKFVRVRQGVRDRVLRDLHLIPQIPIRRCPSDVAEAIMDQHPFEARHEHAQEASIGLECLRGRVRLGDERFDVQH